MILEKTEPHQVYVQINARNMWAGFVGQANGCVSTRVGRLFAFYLCSQHVVGSLYKLCTMQTKYGQL